MYYRISEVIWKSRVDGLMGRNATILREQLSGAAVAAVLDDLLTLELLFDAEEQWCVHRVRILRDLSAANVQQPDWPESVHWNWGFKAAISDPHRLDALGDIRLFGIEADAQWQGLLFGLSGGHASRIAEVGRPLVYVDFLEAAPWNWDIAPLSRSGKFRGIGGQLMELAVRWSLSLGYRGRVGLHSLPQADGFYAGRCRMENLGADSGYNGLCYFELAESNVLGFLRSNR